jgi:hypothetical protein
MVKYLLGFFLLAQCSWLGVFAASPQSLTKDQIILTEYGIYSLYEGCAVPISTISFIGNGIYSAEYYGHCGRCGWPVDQNGKCTNQNCNQYGPRERD